MIWRSRRPPLHLARVQEGGKEGTGQEVSCTFVKIYGPSPGRLGKIERHRKRIEFLKEKETNRQDSHWVLKPETQTPNQHKSMSSRQTLNWERRWPNKAEHGVKRTASRKTAPPNWQEKAILFSSGSWRVSGNVCRRWSSFIGLELPNAQVQRELKRQTRRDTVKLPAHLARGSFDSHGKPWVTLN